MIERYARPEMKKIWSEDGKFRRWLDVEIAVCEVLAERGEIPAEAVAVIREKASVDPLRVAEIEAEVRHDVIAFLSAVSETAVRKAMTSCRTSASISATRAGSTEALVRIAATASAGISPRSASTSQTAISTSSQRRNLPSSLQISFISGRE